MIRLIIIIMMLALIWAEVQVFAVIGGAIGAVSVILATILTAVLGVRLFRHHGKQIIRRVQKTPMDSTKTMLEMADGGAIILAAALLLIPGFITDALGFVLFIPGLRTLLALILAAMVLKALPKGRVFFYNPLQSRAESDSNEQSNSTATVIEGEFERKD